ncbi:opacity protein-like surface antigen [Volucribacter psittacicida]|uniref:Opacity protein-like surface antigen n=1 Tax=Volucribacter psittacicida TaxID=203482 RepID=A0A4R1G0I1_9PAST|nr:opacity family porin [Volucribacter psittacicida]TCJ98458.1 opacity protein-like surface antigen [Volucribacter psittacicida]
MKKTLMAVALATTLAAPSLLANVYVQGDLGYSRTKIEDYKKNRFEPRLSVGYQLQDFRLALDYTYYRNINYSYNNGYIGNKELKTNGIGFSMIYDIPVQSELKPYVGTRLAINRLKLTDTRVGNYSSYSNTNLGYGLVAGVTYPLAQNLKLNAGVEYNHLGRIDDTNVRNYGAKVGLRYDF